MISILNEQNGGMITGQSVTEGPFGLRAGLPAGSFLELSLGPGAEKKSACGQHPSSKLRKGRLLWEQQLGSPAVTGDLPSRE